MKCFIKFNLLENKLQKLFRTLNEIRLMQKGDCFPIREHKVRKDLTNQQIHLQQISNPLYNKEGKLKLWSSLFPLESIIDNNFISAHLEIKIILQPKSYCMRVCQADIIFITADLSDLDSLSKARQIVKESSKRKHRFKGSMILLGTKSDIKTYQPQYFEILSEIIQRFDIPYFEVSAKYDENVKEAFEFGFSKFLQKQNENRCQNGKQQKAQDDNQF